MSDWQLDKRELDNYITKDDTELVDSSEAWYRLFEDIAFITKEWPERTQAYFPYLDFEQVVIVVDPANYFASDFYGWTLTIDFENYNTDDVLIYCHTRISTENDGWTGNDVPETHLEEVKASLFAFVDKVKSMLAEAGASNVSVKYMDKDAPEVL